LPKVIVPPPYRGPTRGLDVVEVEGGSVRACIEAADARFPGFAAQIFDAAGRPHRFVKLFRNGELVAAGDLDRAVEPGDAIEIVAAIAGG
jgi:hypothetical protein